MNEPLLTLIGNLTADPELRYTQAGVAVTGFTVAATPRVKDTGNSEWIDGTPIFQRCSVWREPAENVAASLHKGDRVIVHGRLVSKKFTDKDGNERTSLELDVDEVAPSLRYATAQVVKAQGNRNQQGHQQAARQQGGPANQRPPQQGGQPQYAPPQQQGYPPQQPQYAPPQAPGGQQWAQPGYDDETPF